MNTFTATYAETWKIGLIIVFATLVSGALAAHAGQQSLAPRRAPPIVAAQTAAFDSQPTTGTNASASTYSVDPERGTN